MRKRPGWRSPEYVDVLKDLDRAGFAWEFLRRNPAYQEDYGNTQEKDDDQDGNPPALGWHWGLSFRLRSSARRDGCSGFVAARSPASYRGSRTGT